MYGLEIPIEVADEDEMGEVRNRKARKDIRYADCQDCRKCGSNKCGNDMTNFSCFEQF